MLFRSDFLEVRRAQVDDREIELSESLGWDVEPIFRKISPGERYQFNEW